MALEAFIRLCPSRGSAGPWEVQRRLVPGAEDVPDGQAVRRLLDRAVVVDRLPRDRPPQRAAGQHRQPRMQKRKDGRRGPSLRDARPSMTGRLIPTAQMRDRIWAGAPHSRRAAEAASARAAARAAWVVELGRWYYSAATAGGAVPPCLAPRFGSCAI